MNHNSNLCVIAGPTASGKTAVAVALAELVNGEVVSADSMQIYRGFSIATAKPTREEMRGIPHHLIDFWDPAQPFSVAQYAQQARSAIEDIQARGKLPILAGGTGLYIQAITDNLVFTPMPSDLDLRNALTLRANREGGEVLLQELEKVDPDTAASLHPHNTGRIIRALEVYLLTGETMTQQRKKSRAVPCPYTLSMFGLDFHDRQVLYERINQRVHCMMQNGLLEEARSFYQKPVGHTLAQAIGYKELKPFLDGLCSLEEAVECLQRETRRYAKRQLTWFRRDARFHWILMDEKTEMADILKFIKIHLEKDGILC